jgi:Flp pilus assembly protein TadD
LAQFCQHTIVGLIMATLMAAPLLLAASRPGAVGPMQMAIALAAGLWIVRISSVPILPLVFSPLGGIVLLATTFVIVRYSLVDVEPVARQPMMLVVTAALMFFLLLNNVRHRWQISLLMWVLTVTGCLVAIRGLSEFLVTSLDLMARRQDMPSLDDRPIVAWLPMEHVTGYLQIVMPVCASGFLFSRRSYRQRLALLAATMLMAACLIVSRELGALFGLATSFLVLGTYLLRKRGTRFRWILIGGGAALAVLVVILLMITNRRPTFEERGGVIPGLKPASVNQAQLQTRSPQLGSPLNDVTLSTWRSALGIARQNILLGAGPGMFPWMYLGHRTAQGNVSACSNEYLNVLATYGVVGGVLLAGMVAMFIYTGVQILLVRAERYSASTQSNRYAFAIGGVAAIAAVLAQAVFDNNLHHPATILTLVSVLAVTLTCGVHGREEMQENSGPGYFVASRLKGINRYLLAGAIAAVALMHGWWILRSYPVDVLKRLGEKALLQLDWTGAQMRFQQAWRFDPRDHSVAMLLGDLLLTRATWQSDRADESLRQAMIWYNRALILNPYAAESLVRVASIYDRLGQRDQAFERYQRALRLDPLNAALYTQLGQHHLRWGDAERAAAAYRAALDLNPAGYLAEIQLSTLSLPQP